MLCTINCHVDGNISDVDLWLSLRNCYTSV